jgi:hypothetical protein
VSNYLASAFELLAYLNSRAAWFWAFGEASPLRGGQWRLELREQHISQFPIPEMRPSDRASLATLGETCTSVAKRLNDVRSAVSHRISIDLAPPDHTKSSRRLENWWNLDFASFRVEVRRVSLADIPVKERAEWERYLAENAAEVKRMTAEIEAAEREIDAVVYRLLDLTPDEIALLETSLAGQY